MSRYPGDLSRKELEHRLLRLEDRVLDGDTPDDIEWGSEDEPLPPAHHESLSTGKLNNSLYVNPNDDLRAKHDSLSAGQTLAVFGSHTLSSPLTPIDGTDVIVFGEISAADGAVTSLFRRTTQMDYWRFACRGSGVLDGNKSNISYSGSRENHDIIHIEQADTLIIDNARIRNAVAGGGIFAVEVSDLQINNPYIYDMGQSNTPSDGIFTGKCSGTIADATVVNVTDTHIANDSPQGLTVEDADARNTNDFNANVQPANQGITGYPKLADSQITITNPVIDNPGYVSNSGAGDAIDTLGDNGYEVKITVENPVVTGTHNRGVNFENCVESATVINPEVEGGTGPAIRAVGGPVDVIGGDISTTAEYGILSFPGVTVRCCGTSISSFSDIGVWAQGAGSRIIDADINGVGGSGVGVQLEASDCQVSGTDIDGCTDPVAIAGGGQDFNLIHHNNWRGCTNSAISGTTGSNSITTPNIGQ